MGLFGSDNDSGSSLSSSGFGGSSDTTSDNSSSSLGSNLGGFSGYSSNSSDSGGISSNLDGGAGASLSPSGGTSSDSSGSFGGNTSSSSDSSQGYGFSSNLTSSYASPASSPSLSNCQLDSSSFNSQGLDATQSTASAQLDNSAGSLTGTQLSGTVDSGFNANMNGFHLDGTSGSSLVPSLGIVGGTSYSSPITTYDYSNMSGFHLSDSTGMAQGLSAIVASNNYNDISNYFDNTSLSSNPNTETSTSLLGRAWNTVTELGNKNIVQPLQAAYDNYVTKPLNNLVVTPASQNDIAETLGPTTFLTESDALAALQKGETSWTALNKNGLVEDKSIGEKYGNFIKDAQEIGDKWSKALEEDKATLKSAMKTSSQTYDRVNEDSSTSLLRADPRIPISALTPEAAKRRQEMNDAEGQVMSAFGQYIKVAAQVPLTAAFMSRIPVVSQVAGAVVAPMYAYDLTQSYAKNLEQGHNPFAAAGITAYNATLGPAVKIAEEVGTGEYSTKLNERPISTMWDTAMAVEGARFTGNALSKTVEGVNSKFDVKVDTPKLDFSQGPDVAIAGGSVLRDAKTDIASESSAFSRILSQEEKIASETARPDINTTGVLIKEAEQLGLKTENGEGISESTKKHSFDDTINSSVVGKYEDGVLDIEGPNKVTSYERTQAEFDALAKDPSHAGRIEPQGIKEREIGLDLERQGELGKIIRDPQITNGAEFIDTTTGVKWDIKSFESYPNGHTDPRKGAFTVDKAMKNINKEFGKNHNVILDTRNLIPEHVDQLKTAIEKAGILDRIILWP